MRIKYIAISLFILTFIVIGLIIILTKEKPNIKQVIEQSITEQENLNSNENDNSENFEEQNNHENQNANQQAEDEMIDIFEPVKKVIDLFLKSNYEIVAIGDSLTQGVGDQTNQGGYVGILDQMINHEKTIVSFHNYGKAGNRTDQLIKRLDEEEISNAISRSDIVLITIGANDIMKVAKENFMNLTYHLFADEKIHYENRLYNILQRIKELNLDAHIYLLGIYNPFEQYFGEIKELNSIVNDWNLTSRSVTKEFENTTFIPIKDIFENTTLNLFSNDHFHPNRAGYHRIAERVLDYLIEEEG